MDDLPEVFLAWLAGFIDGDGGIGIYENGGYLSPRLYITQKDRAVLDYIQDQLKIGSIHKHTDDTHQLVFGSKATRQICEKILPYLWIKKEKAKEVLAHNLKIRKDSIKQRPEVETASKMYREGSSVQMIAKKIEQKPATVNYWLRELGVTRSYKEAQQLRRQREHALW